MVETHYGQNAVVTDSSICNKFHTFSTLSETIIFFKMKKNILVFHKRHPGLILRVVSPPSRNGYLVMICETLIGGTNIIITDVPENFLPA